jgi:hypothetical protein
MKKLHRLLLLLVSALTLLGQVEAQCPQGTTVNVSPQPDNCQNALNIVPYFTQCRTICLNNTGMANSTGVNNLGCFGGSAPNDLWLKAPNPYNSIAGYDGSLVFRWVDWPNRATGGPTPNMSIHAEVGGTAGGIISINIDCTSPAPTQSDNFASENVICVNNSNGEQFYAPAGTIPTVSQIANSGFLPSGISLSNIEYYMQIATVGGATGPICFEVSPYKQGFVCGDTKNVPLSGNSSSVSGSASGCLCETALNGTMNNALANNLPIPCGVESPAAAWYQITLPFACNKVDLSLGSWGGTGSYNLVLLSDVVCPGTSSTNPITGATVTNPGATLAPGAIIQASACNGSISTCTPLPAGTYYVYISGATERPTFTLNVNVQNVASTAGSITSPQNNGSVCSGGTAEVNLSGAVLPLSATCGQSIAWYYSTNIAFNPYNGQGTYLGSGTTAQTFTMPTNTGCQPLTYYIKGVVSDNGTTAQAGCQSLTNAVAVTVYPEIGLPTIVNNPCIITVAGRCPSFTVNGQTGSSTYLATFADDGTSRSFTISNGLGACNTVVTETVSCSGNCVQPTATAVAACNSNDPFNFYINVNFTPGSASSYIIQASDGTQLAASTAGVYQIGPFANGNTISLSVTNTEDANCNLPLGSYSSFCNPNDCSNLTSAFASTQSGTTSIGANTSILLQATVDQGILNTNFTAQWYMNGVAIPGATFLVYNHTARVSQGCAPEVQVYSVVITCLDPAASPATTTTLNVSSGPITVYPIPVFGVDFYPSPNTCTVAPIDACGGLNIAITPSTNPAVGSGTTTVSYTVSVAGAPAGVAATGTYTIQCPVAACTASAGNGNTPADNNICAGESLQLSTTGTSLPSGYVLGYAVTTTNPFSNLSTAVNTAITQGNILGPYTAASTPSFTNGVDYNAGTYYFVPFTSMQFTQNQVAYQTTGSFSVSAPFQGGSAVITIPQVPYCSGLTQFDITLTVQQTNNTGSVSAIDGISSNIPGISYSGGSVTSRNLSSNNFTGNPSGQQITINGSGNLFFGANISYTLTIRYDAVPFGSRCGSCNDVGNPLTYNLLPAVTLSSIGNIPVCNGNTINLSNAQPSANVAGSYAWFDADPASGATPLASTVVTPASTGSTYWTVFYAAQDSACSDTTSRLFTPTALPSVNPITPPATICAGDVVNLNALNSQVSTAPGTFTWFRGNPQTNQFAVQLPSALASAQQPSNGTTYWCRFTNAATGCSNYSDVTYTVSPLPALTPPFVSPTVCQDGSYDLTQLEPILTSDAGLFAWYQGDPDNGGTLVSNTTVNPTSGSSTYCAVFTDDLTQCSNKVCISIDITPLPALTSIPQQAPICSGTVVDLTALEAGMTSAPGTFEWFLGNPATTGTPILDPTMVTPVNGNNFFVRFTSSISGCSNTRSTQYTVNPTPSVLQPTLTPLCAGQSVNLVQIADNLVTSSGSYAFTRNGNALTLGASQNQVPVAGDAYTFTFTNIQGCSVTQNWNFTVNPLPTFNAVTPDPLCNASSVDISSYNAQLTSRPGQFTWFTNGTQIATNQLGNQVPVDGQTYVVRFRDDTTTCISNDTLAFTVYPVVSGATATYDCNLNQLQVNLGPASGGSGAGYVVAANSPNSAGQTLANGANWSVIVSDGAGCLQAPINGTVSCIVCDAGDAVASSVDTLCCGSSVTIQRTASTLTSGQIVAWTVTSAPVTSSADVAAAQAAGNVYLANADGSYTLSNNCTQPSGSYYVTPFIADDIVVDPLVWDTLSGCRPDADICPNLITDPQNPGWLIDTLLGVYPNGDTVDLVAQLTTALLGVALPIDINQLVLDQFLGGTLPCLQLTSLFNGNPNGDWAFVVINSGTGPLTFEVPAFNVVVDADSCLQLNGVDQVVTVPAQTVIIPANGQPVSINFTLPPPPASFPTIDPFCEDYGTPTVVYFDNCSGTNDIPSLSQVRLFPNPTNGLVQVQFDLNQSTELNFVVRDALGKVVLAETHALSAGAVNQTLDLNRLSNGVYTVEITGPSVQNVLKLVKQ